MIYPLLWLHGSVLNSIFLFLSGLDQDGDTTNTLLICAVEMRALFQCCCCCPREDRWANDALCSFDPCVRLPWPGHKPAVNHRFVVAVLHVSSSPIQLPPSIPTTIRPTSSHFSLLYSNLSFIYSSSQSFSPWMAGIVTKGVTTGCRSRGEVLLDFPWVESGHQIAVLCEAGPRLRNGHLLCQG